LAAATGVSCTTAPVLSTIRTRARGPIGLTQPANSVTGGDAALYTPNFRLEEPAFSTKMRVAIDLPRFVPPRFDCGAQYAKESLPGIGISTRPARVRVAGFFTEREPAEEVQT